MIYVSYSKIMITFIPQKLIHVDLKDMLVRLKLRSISAAYRHACKSRDYSRVRVPIFPGSKARFKNDTFTLALLCPRL